MTSPKPYHWIPPCGVRRCSEPPTVWLSSPATAIADARSSARAHRRESDRSGTSPRETRASLTRRMIVSSGVVEAAASAGAAVAVAAVAARSATPRQRRSSLIGWRPRSVSRRGGAWRPRPPAAQPAPGPPRRRPRPGSTAGSRWCPTPSRASAASRPAAVATVCVGCQVASSTLDATRGAKRSTTSTGSWSAMMSQAARSEFVVAAGSGGSNVRGVSAALRIRSTLNVRIAPRSSSKPIR